MLGLHAASSASRRGCSFRAVRITVASKTAYFRSSVIGSPRNLGLNYGRGRRRDSTPSLVWRFLRSPFVRYHFRFSFLKYLWFPRFPTPRSEEMVCLFRRIILKVKKLRLRVGASNTGSEKAGCANLNFPQIKPKFPACQPRGGVFAIMREQHA
jgi:hypothetical protein